MYIMKKIKKIQVPMGKEVMELCPDQRRAAEIIDRKRKGVTKKYG